MLLMIDNYDSFTYIEMERNHDNRSSNEQADRHFHLAIARATGNSAMVGVIDYLWNQRGSLWHKLKDNTVYLWKELL